MQRQRRRSRAQPRTRARPGRVHHCLRDDVAVERVHDNRGTSNKDVDVLGCSSVTLHLVVVLVVSMVVVARNSSGQAKGG